MCEENQTQLTEIHLLGFRGLHKFKTLLFIVFILTYTFILAGNLLIILLVTTVDHLKTPMFFFLKHLSTADVLLTTSIVPMMLNIILQEGSILPFWGCILQLYFFGNFEFVQCFLIAVMSFDRYLAICHPLRYSSVMRPNLCLQLVIVSWFLINMLMSSETIVLVRFNFCGLNYIDHFFCDFGPVVELATSDISMLMLQDFITSICMIFSPFAFIILTYLFISITIIKMSSTSGRQKAFSTCSSHLITVCVYYGTLMTVYMAPAEGSATNTNKYRSLLYVVVTPVMNPIIYSLRNNEIKRAIQKMINHVIQNGRER